jgi:hypothetical protein
VRGRPADPCACDATAKRDGCYCRAGIRVAYCDGHAGGHCHTRADGDCDARTNRHARALGDTDSNHRADCHADGDAG